MHEHEILNVEIDLLLEAVFRRYGYDFREYSRASITRRVNQFLILNRVESVSELLARVMRDEDLFTKLARNFSITTSVMFRDPHVYATLRREVLPFLKTFPFVKIWHAGCSTGEEVYSLAILLKEEGFYDHCTIFATDFNDEALETAQGGIYALERAREFTANYQKAGGKASFSDYYSAMYDNICMDPALRERVTFANYNLVTDEVFGDMNLVMCRNVLIYFNRELKDRVLELFSRSLHSGGFLCLGDKESLRFSSVEADFGVFEPACRIYRRLNGAPR